MPSIISRGTWGARYARGFRAASIPASEVWLHHSVTSSPSPSASLNQDAAAVRTLENIGQNRFGGGISYSFIVARSGRIFEGHGVDRQGAHTGGRNHISRAICLIGNYENLSPTQAQLNAVAWLLRHGRAKGWWRGARLNGGHRDLKATACPGRHAYSQISTINARAASGGSAPPSEEDPLMAISGSESEVLDKIARSVQRYRGADYVNDDTTSKDHQIAKAHEYAWKVYQVLANSNTAMARYPHNDGEGSVRYAAEQGWRRAYETSQALTEPRAFHYWEDGEKKQGEASAADMLGWIMTAVNESRQQANSEIIDALSKINERLDRIESREQ